MMVIEIAREDTTRMKLVNLTSRTIRVFDSDGTVPLYELPTNPPAPSVEAPTEVLSTVGDPPVEVVRHRFRLTSELPKPKKGVVYVVGWPVIQALLDEGLSRPDLVAPDTGRESAVRNAEGHIVGVRRFRVA